jgi:predicted MFS family arabinose efflux permease
MPLHSFIGESFGWRWAFALVAGLSLLAAAAVWRALPAGLHAAPLSLASWRTALTHPLLIGVVAVTALSAAGQFTLFSYFAPYYRQELGTSAAGVSGLFLWFGLFGLIGNLLLTRFIERIGAARCATLMMGCMAISLLAWPLAGTVATMALVLVPWALGCFSTNSAQQARLAEAAPALAPALLALNTSAIYLGQAVGAAGGGALILHSGYSLLHWAGLAWMLVAIALSVLILQRSPRRGPVGAQP